MVNELIDKASSPIGGAGGGIIASITAQGVWEVIVFALVGSIVGLAVREGAAYCKNKIKKKK